MLLPASELPLQAILMPYHIRDISLFSLCELKASWSKQATLLSASLFGGCCCPSLVNCHKMPSEAGPQSPQQSTPPPPSSPSSSDGNADGADFVHSKPQEEQLWHEFGNPEKPVNLIPGGTTRPTAAEAQRNTEKSLSAEPLSVEGLKNVHKTPCARDSLLVGIAGGLGVGSIKAMVGGITLTHIWILISGTQSLILVSFSPPLS